MKILAIETTQRQGSIALLEPECFEFHHRLPADNRSAATLAPAIKALCEKHNWTLTDVDLIAVTSGPGSFTGLRVGIVTAKTLGWALNKQVTGINTLDAIAIQSSQNGELEVVMDAQRNEVFTRRYLIEEGKMPQPLNDVTILDDQLWASQLPAGCRISGPVLKKLKETLPSNIEIEDEANWAPRAESVAKLAQFAIPLASPLQLMPQYFRRSAAEEKLAASR